MNNDLHHKCNERKVSFLYPKHGSRNVLRSVTGVKIASFTGPSGRGITVREDNGLHKSFSLSMCVASGSDELNEEDNTFQREPFGQEVTPLFDEAPAKTEGSLPLDLDKFSQEQSAILQKPEVEEPLAFPVAEDTQSEASRNYNSNPFSEAKSTSANKADLIREKFLRLAAERAALMSTEEIGEEVEQTEARLVELKARRAVTEAVANLADVKNRYPETLAASQARAMMDAYGRFSDGATTETERQRETCSAESEISTAQTVQRASV